MARTRAVGKPTTRAKTGMIRARVDPELKARAEVIMERLGLSASDVIRLLYKQIALRQGLPFEVAIPNAATRKALREADRGRGSRRHARFEDFAREMQGDAE
jgi:DNA-damage-inducible protein J